MAANLEYGWNKDINIPSDKVIRIGGVPKLTFSGAASGNITLGGNTISTLNENGNIELDPNGTGMVLLSKETDLAEDALLKFRHDTPGDAHYGLLYDSNANEFRLVVDQNVTTASDVVVGFYDGNDQSGTWHDCVIIDHRGSVNILLPPGSALPAPQLMIGNEKVLTTRQAAVPDVSPITAAPTINSGATNVTSENATDLDTLADFCVDLRGDVDAMRSTINDLLFKLRAHGLIQS